MLAHSRTFVLGTAVALLILAPAAFANTFVIDDDGGPSVDFTDLPPAIAAAAPGDVLLVRAGNYTSFTLSKGILILGAAGAFVGGPSSVIAVDSVPAGQIAVLADLKTGTLRVKDCTGTVVAQRVTAAFEVQRSRDVRMWKVTGVGASFPSFGAALDARDSRVEVVDSMLSGRQGLFYPGSYGDPGSPGVSASGAGFGARHLVHLALTSCRGGRGAMGGNSFGFPLPAGNGGPGVVLSTGQVCDLVIAGGDVASILGGEGGLAPLQCLGTRGGDALSVSSPAARISGMTLLPGVGCAGTGAQIYAPDPSNVSIAPLVDPTLDIAGEVLPGAAVTVRVRSEPGSRAFVYIGRKPIVSADGFAGIERLVEVLRPLRLGLIPASGAVVYTQSIPVRARVGTSFYLQGAVILPTGEYRRTNSIAMIVR